MPGHALELDAPYIDLGTNDTGTAIFFGLLTLEPVGGNGIGQAVGFGYPGKAGTILDIPDNLPAMNSRTSRLARLRPLDKQTHQAKQIKAAKNDYGERKPGTNGRSNRARKKFLGRRGNKIPEQIEKKSAVDGSGITAVYV